MLLSAEDVERLGKKGYQQEFFALSEKQGYLKLRNLNNHCIFFSVENRRCIVYHYKDGLSSLSSDL
jgi:Fe-S-cluster containining protein